MQTQLICLIDLKKWTGNFQSYQIKKLWILNIRKKESWILYVRNWRHNTLNTLHHIASFIWNKFKPFMHYWSIFLLFLFRCFLDIGYYFFHIISIDFSHSIFSMVNQSYLVVLLLKLYLRSSHNKWLSFPQSSHFSCKNSISQIASLPVTFCNSQYAFCILKHTDKLSCQLKLIIYQKGVFYLRQALILEHNQASKD